MVGQALDPRVGSQSGTHVLFNGTSGGKVPVPVLGAPRPRHAFEATTAGGLLSPSLKSEVMYASDDDLGARHLGHSGAAAGTQTGCAGDENVDIYGWQ